MDEELKTLTEEVFKRTGWHGIDHALANLTPVYTSDYILERIPIGSSTSNVFAELKLTRFLPDKWGAYWHTEDDEFEILEIADNSLKALLKLVIALDDANQLPKSPKQDPLQGGE